MVPREQLIAWLNSIEWLRPDKITPDAEALIQDHLTKIRTVIREVMASKNISADEAHGAAQNAGHDTPEQESLLDELFSKVKFQGAGVRTALIGNIAACYCWHLDPELRHLPNPWEPLMDLYGMRYTTSTDSDPDGETVSLLVGYKDAVNSYRII